RLHRGPVDVALIDADVDALHRRARGADGRFLRGAERIVRVRAAPGEQRGAEEGGQQGGEALLHSQGIRRWRARRKTGRTRYRVSKEIRSPRERTVLSEVRI